MKMKPILEPGDIVSVEPLEYFGGFVVTVKNKLEGDSV